MRLCPTTASTLFVSMPRSGVAVDYVARAGVLGRYRGCDGMAEWRGRMVTALLLATGGFWTAAYVLLIRVGVRERTFGMPVAAFATNISWEFMFAFVRSPVGVQQWINVVWFGFD